MALTDIAQSTLSVVAEGGYVAPSGVRRELRAAIDRAIDGTRLYRPEELEELVGRPSLGGSAPEIVVTEETTAAAARRLAAGGRVAALNFASAKNPGGGFLGGAKAQEEDLARCSALYSCQLNARAYYDANRACASMLYTDHLIHSPDVPFFRDDSLEFLEESFLCSILTSPAPNAGEVLRRDAQGGASIRHTLERRAAMVLAIAEAKGDRRLVLGAWGCGVFRNDPAEVAAIFRRLLSSERFAGAFDLVVFAIYDRRPGQPVLSAFRHEFEGALGE